MEFLLPSFLAGFITIMAPCTFSVLPLVLGGNVGTKDKWRPLIVALSLAISVFCFSLLLKGTTLLLRIPSVFWKFISGGLIIFFAVTMLYPLFWAKLAYRLGFFKTEEILAKSLQFNTRWGAVFIGGALGPVFSSCSPTYALLLAIIFPANFLIGSINIFAFCLGLMVPVLFIGYGGQKFSNNFKWMVNPTGIFKKGIAVFLFVLGVLVLGGYDKIFAEKIFTSGYARALEVEQKVIDRFR